MIIKFGSNRGFSLIEVLVVIVIVGVAAATALQWMTGSVEDMREVETEREMEMIAFAVTGDPSQLQDGKRSDFGYVGDIGAFPASIDDLYRNPGGYGTWDGPYIMDGLTGDSLGFKSDEWGKPYSYTPTSLTSSGGGSNIKRRIAANIDNYLYNNLSGVIKDGVDSVPGPVFADSVSVEIVIPDGAGSNLRRILNPSQDGTFLFDSIPAGRHPIEIIFTPMVDTLFKYVTVLPGNREVLNIKFAAAHFSSELPIIGEVGEIIASQTAGEWYQVNLNNTYTNPVVVMRNLSYNGGDPCHMRVRNVTANSFEWQIEEWSYLDKDHMEETMPYIVVEAGVYTLPDGTVLQAGMTTTTSSFKWVYFPVAFSSTPALITGVTTLNETDPCVTRTRSVSSTRFRIMVQEEEAGDSHGSETVSWIALSQGSGVNNGIQYLVSRTPDAITHSWYTINFSPAFSSTPIFLGHDDTRDGGNTASMRFRNLNQSSVQVMIEEEKSNDSEINHVTERVSYLVWGSSGNIVANSL